MKAKHTPGPWYASFLGNGTAIIKNDEFASAIALTYGQNTSTVEADAYLLAAAPDLLEALRKVANYMSATGKIELRSTLGFGFSAKELEDILAKAEGS